MIDILIVGAGPSGLCAAKTFLQYDPSTEIVVVESRASLGGVWSKEQLYPTLKTNNLLGTLDLLDFEMDDSFGIKPEQHVPGDVMNTYFSLYADHFDLTRRIRFNTRVVEISRRDGGDGWSVRTESVQAAGGDADVLECKKLVIATGLTNLPHLPGLKGVADFEGPVLHSSEMGSSSAKIVNNPDVKTVAVLGGAKSAYDAVFLAASTGHKVEWIIRKSGRGPTWVFPTHTYLGPFRAWREMLIARRFITMMSPCIWPDFSGLSWLRRFLHGNSIGKFISQTFWGLIHADTIHDCKYKTDPAYGILEPEQSPFWYESPVEYFISRLWFLHDNTTGRTADIPRYGTASGTLGYDTDILSYLRSGQVRVHRTDIDHLSENTVHLSDGTALSADAFISATGFSPKPNIKFVPASLHSDLGIPTSDMSQAQKSFWEDLDSKADLAIGKQFPRLLHGPYKSPGSDVPAPFNLGMPGEVSYSPWRLYRGTAPPGLAASGDRSLVYLGMVSNTTNFFRLDVQCLWALAYLNNKLPSLDRDIAAKNVFNDTALTQRYCQHRAPYGHGAFYPDLNFDQMPYWDVLLNDLGIKCARKNTVWKELFEPYTWRDFKGLTQEWIDKNKS
jgi:cation diffusion facilitator CzcD-associated flavoprotein CzcO